MNQHDHLTRQMDLIPLSVLGEQITIIGAGAIGSFATLQLAKMGFYNITVIDDDSVTIENMNCQFYRRGDVGKAKVDALQALVEDFTGMKITVQNGRYKADVFPGTVISAVDNMETRAAIFYAHTEKGYATRAIIDPRMGAEMMALHVTKPMDKEMARDYAATLFSDKDAVPERCTAKSTMYTTNIIAGLVAKTVKDLVVENGKPLRCLQWAVAENDMEQYPI